MKFDIIGDIHGCYQELLLLIEQLGYKQQGAIFVHPENRKLAFVGDAMDRGPESLNVLRLLFALQDENSLYYSPGNHCNKLYRFFKGHPVQLAHGLEMTVAEWEQLPSLEKQQFKKRYLQFYEQLPHYQQFDNDLIIAHAGLKAEMIGKPLSRGIAVFVLYGDITGKFHSDGRPVRRNWAKSYKGHKWVVYGHTPTEKPYFNNNTVNIDTGCVFGGALSAFRFPEKKTVSVPSLQPYQPDRFYKYD
ncbi:bis(5'-nucleosyl)-tetraphosphatase PrpE [Planococcus donghaensis MPA1U2]|uniref:Bis(5'-nucleosyl)-tetraphosphatase PrpE n=1 Tax=Planococcus donghaensis MPA1U2 TaxID=933115 RepID=E7RF79_9BACL|nr:bis(5'-nucleosyl)-tetraphosphatase PrpE [Planococcus donghaensis]EGA90299.1 bis(5'-nucleosyl)-tetraphosphatase PrpE [Planococcus donghaensis MPA1U2]